MTTMFDLAINNALIVDGSGAPARPGAVGIRGGKIAAVSGTELQAAASIDAGGQVLAPGFIDLHSHADFTLGTDPQALTQISQGVTTLLTGNCGSSPFPLKDVDALKSAVSFLEPVLDWDWQDAAGFAASLDANRPAVNTALQVGHSALRLAVIGDEQRPPAPGELEQMQDLLREAAAQGVRGYSTGLIYAPCSYAGTDEVTALAQTAADCGMLYSTHMRNETDRLLEAVEEAIAVARSTGVRLEISHIKAMGPRNHGQVAEALQLMAEARAEGIDVTADVYPYTASSTTLNSRLPDWSLDGGAPALLGRLADPAARRRIRSALAERFEGEIDPAGIVLASMPPGKYSRWIGQPLTEIADAAGLSPAEAALDVLAEHRATVAIVNHAMADADVQAALQDPFVAVASDGWIMTESGSGTPHPRSFGTFTRVLGRYVRELGTLSLEEAVRKMTSLPAGRAGLQDRGSIGVGMAADLTVFDPRTVADRSTYAEPWQLSTGITHVVVGGEPVWADGAATGVRAGRIL